MSKPTKEYYVAKADLCLEVAMKAADEGDVGSALTNLLRAQNAIEIIRLEEESGLWKRK